MTVKRPTLADVAARAGLSKTAASLILNNRPGSRLAADSVERVRAAALELGYRPNPAAKVLLTGKTKTIGFISDQVTVTRFASAMIRGVLDVAAANNHTVLIAETGDDLDQDASALSAIFDRRADGVIFGMMAAREIEIPEIPGGLPVVLLNGRTSSGAASVLPDEYHAGYDVTKILLDNGHTQIGLVGDYPEAASNPRISIAVGQRFAGIAAALEDFGVELAVKEPVHPWEPKFGFAATTHLLSAAPRVTAIICLNDRLAFGAYQALQEAGLRIPADMSVVSFDDDEIADYLRPGLTTARLPYEAMGRQSVELVLGLRDLNDNPLVPMPVVARQSVRRVGPPRPERAQ
jgi:LacI family transcriptional regulator